MRALKCHGSSVAGVVDFQPEKQDQIVDAAEKTAIHWVTMKGVPYDLSNDNEFAVFLEDLLNSSLQERPEALQYAGARIKAWLRAHELVSELERLGLLRG
jgi:hypothetical protein